MTSNTGARLLASATITACLSLAGPALAQEHDHHDMTPPAEAEAEATADHGMTSPLGAYPMSRDASGASWQPEAAPHGGLHSMSDGWMIMGHALINGVYASQDGPRGDD